MNAETNPEATPTGSADPETGEVVVTDLIEDVSIDGMCGVY